MKRRWRYNIRAPFKHERQLASEPVESDQGACIDSDQEASLSRAFLSHVVGRSAGDPGG